MRGSIVVVVCFLAVLGAESVRVMKKLAEKDTLKNEGTSAMQSEESLDDSSEKGWEKCCNRRDRCCAGHKPHKDHEGKCMRNNPGCMGNGGGPRAPARNNRGPAMPGHPGRHGGPGMQGGNNFGGMHGGPGMQGGNNFGGMHGGPGMQGGMHGGPRMHGGVGMPGGNNFGVGPGMHRGGGGNGQVLQRINRLPTHSVNEFARGLWRSRGGNMDMVFDAINGRDDKITYGEWRRAVGGDTVGTNNLFRVVASQDGGRGAAWDDDRTIDRNDWNRFFTQCRNEASSFPAADDVFGAIVSAKVTAELLFNKAERGRDWDHTLSGDEWNACYWKFVGRGTINRREFARGLRLEVEDIQGVFAILEAAGDFAAGGRRSRNDANTIDQREWQSLFPFMIQFSASWSGRVTERSFINEVTAQVVRSMYGR